MKMYSYIIRGDGGPNDVTLTFEENRLGSWINIEDLTNKEISELHPYCTTCDHCYDEVLENEYENTTITFSLCVIEPDEPKMVSKRSHYCALHTDLK